MARISLSRLIRVIMGHLDYHECWHKGVPANQSLYITFDESKDEQLSSTVFTTSSGLELILDLDQDDKVHGIEIT